MRAACAATTTPTPATREELARLRADGAWRRASPASSPAFPAITSGSKRTPRFAAPWHRCEILREGLGPDIDIAVDFHAKTSPSVARILVKEVEPLNLLFMEEPCPPENVAAMANIARHSTTPIATGERLVASYGCRELIEMGAVDILQTDINHVGGITGLWKVAALAGISGISMAPHACEGPIGGLATLHVDAAMPNFLVQEICGQVQPSAAGQDLGGMVRLPRHAHGGRPLPSARQARPGIRAERSQLWPNFLLAAPGRWRACFTKTAPWRSGDPEERAKSDKQAA